MLAIAYASITIFLIGNLYRILRIALTPAHLRWELYPIPRGSSAQRRRGSSYFEESEWWLRPHRRNLAAEIRFISEEVLLQKSVWTHNRLLWPWTLLMHAGLYATLMNVALALVWSFSRGTPILSLVWLSAAIGMFAGIVGAAGLITIRISGTRWRPYTSRAALANLFVLAAFFATGCAVLFQSSGGSLVTFVGAVLRTHAAPMLSTGAAAHVAIACLFIAYFPFTQMTHAYMKFFAFHRVRWDDEATATNKQVQLQIAENLRLPITWSAAHIGGPSWGSAVSSTDGQKHA